MNDFLSRISPSSFAKIRPPSPRKCGFTAALTHGTRAVLPTLITSVFTVFAANSPTSAKSFFFVTGSVLPVIGAIRSTNAFKRNSAAGSTRLPTSATAVRNRNTAVQSLTNTITTPILPSASMRNFELPRGKGSTRPERRSTG